MKSNLLKFNGHCFLSYAKLVLGESILFFFFVVQSVYAQNYYLYVASESDDTVSLLKFDGTTIVEEERINVGSYPTEIEGPHGITIDPNGRYWYVTLAHGTPYGSLLNIQQRQTKLLMRPL